MANFLFAFLEILFLHDQRIAQKTTPFKRFSAYISLRNVQVDVRKAIYWETFGILKETKRIVFYSCRRKKSSIHTLTSAFQDDLPPILQGGIACKNEFLIGKLFENSLNIPSI